MYLMIDNFDSFVYNLRAYFEEIGREILVKSCDELTLGDIRDLHPDGIILSPGPKRPQDASLCVDVVKQFQGEIPILGVCLGHQVICEAFGATVTYAKELMHGKVSEVNVSPQSRLFRGLGPTVKVARYHSLAVTSEDLPDCLSVLATTEDGEIMAMRHKDYPVVGLQFHPESIYTQHGKRMIENFVNDVI